MVEYDHLLVQHLQAGHRVDSFDVRKLRHRPTLSPRERWLRVQNHLLTYGEWPCGCDLIRVAKD
jgi:hypothetical protein